MELDIGKMTTVGLVMHYIFNPDHYYDVNGAGPEEQALDKALEAELIRRGNIKGRDFFLDHGTCEDLLEQMDAGEKIPMFYRAVYASGLPEEVPEPIQSAVPPEEE
jgi:hypothetical protein